MKKIFALLVFVLVLAQCSACASGSEPQPAAQFLIITIEYQKEEKVVTITHDNEGIDLLIVKAWEGNDIENAYSIAVNGLTGSQGTPYRKIDQNLNLRAQTEYTQYSCVQADYGYVEGSCVVFWCTALN